MSHALLLSYLEECRARLHRLDAARAEAVRRPSPSWSVLRLQRDIERTQHHLLSAQVAFWVTFVAGITSYDTG